MNNLIIITSVIDTPNKPLSYTDTRSVFTKEERFNDTKKTIQTIKDKIPNCKILLVECSNLNKNEYDYFISNCDYILNLWNNPELQTKIYGVSKSLGEGTMMINALQYIINNRIKHDNLFKISGRYWLNDNFNYNKFDNNLIVFNLINKDYNYLPTVLFKINNNYTNKLYKFLLDSQESMNNCISYEHLISNFIKQFNNNELCFLEKIGITGKVSVCGTLYTS